MSSRTVATNTAVSGPIASPKHISTAMLAAAGISGHSIEHWGDGTYWDTTANAPVCIDKLGLVGTPRAQD